MDESDVMFDVLCYGTISIDNVTRVPALPNPRRDVQALMEFSAVGGEAATVAIALAAWNLRVLIAGNVIGTDWKAQFILEQLAANPNIDLRYVRQHENVITPFTRVLVTPDGERSRIAYWYDQTPKVEVTPAMMRQARVLSTDAYGRSERDRAAGVARELGRTVITSDAIWPQYPLARLSDCVVISRAWLQANFPRVYEYDHVLELQDLGAGTIIVTDGPHPVLVVRADGTDFVVEPFTLDDVVDSSGAGNYFKAALIYGWLQPDWSLEYKVQFACAAAGLSCQREGIEARPPTIAEITALMATRSR